MTFVLVLLSIFVLSTVITAYYNLNTLEKVTKETKIILPTPTKKYTDVKSTIQDALPELPIGLFWQVEKITRQYKEVISFEKLKEKDIWNINSYEIQVKRKADLVLDNHPQFSTLDGKLYTDYFAKISLHDGMSDVRTVEIAIEKETNFLSELAKEVNNKCSQLVEEYNRAADDWSGIYIKNKEK